jgi:hypothetical protein
VCNVYGTRMDGIFSDLAPDLTKSKLANDSRKQRAANQRTTKSGPYCQQLSGIKLMVRRVQSVAPAGFYQSLF